MARLTDTQLVILSAAARRQDSAVLPLPKSLKITGDAATKTLEGLREKGLPTAKPATRHAAAWRGGEAGRRMQLALPDPGRPAHGAAPQRAAGPAPRGATTAADLQLKKPDRHDREPELRL